MKQITLRDHPDEVGTRLCFRCGSHMKPCTTSNTYNLQAGQFHVCNIKAFRCTHCGAEIYSSSEARRIEDALHAYLIDKIDNVGLD